jgi:hypothetical protein
LFASIPRLGERRPERRCYADIVGWAGREAPEKGVNRVEKFVLFATAAPACDAIDAAERARWRLATTGPSDMYNGRCGFLTSGFSALVYLAMHVGR